MWQDGVFSNDLMFSNGLMFARIFTNSFEEPTMFVYVLEKGTHRHAVTAV